MSHIIKRTSDDTAPTYNAMCKTAILSSLPWFAGVCGAIALVICVSAYVMLSTWVLAAFWGRGETIYPLVMFM